MVTNNWTYECAYEGCGKRYCYYGSLINHLLVYHEEEELPTACSYDTAIWKYTYYERGYFERQKKDTPQGEDKDKSAKPPEDETPEVGDDDNDEFYDDIFEMGAETAEADDEEGVEDASTEPADTDANPSPEEEDTSLEPTDSLTVPSPEEVSVAREPKSRPKLSSHAFTTRLHMARDYNPPEPAADLDEQAEPKDDSAGSIVPTVGVETTSAVDPWPAKRRRTDGLTEAKLLLIPTVSENTTICPFQGCDKPFGHFCNHLWAFYDYEIALPPLHLPGRPEDIEELEGENSGKVFSRPEDESRAQVE